MTTLSRMPAAKHHPVREAENIAHQAAFSQGTTVLARLGYAAKGVVYIIVGGLAVRAAIGNGSSTGADQHTALTEIYHQPFGTFLLAVVALGLIGFALWSFIQAWFDTEGKGSDAGGVAGRIGYAAVGLSYAALALGAIQLITNTGSGGKGSNQTTQDWTARLLQEPFGVALVMLVGLIIFGIAVYLLYKAYSARFKRTLSMEKISATAQPWVIGLGRLGFGALGVVFAVIGIFMIVAAQRHSPHTAKGLGGALQELSQQPYGHLILAIVAAGLVAYGIYSFAEARYRRIGWA